MDDKWDNLLGRLKRVAYKNKAYGTVTIDIRLIIDKGELLLWREPEIKRFEPYGTAPTETITGVLADKHTTGVP